MLKQSFYAMRIRFEDEVQDRPGSALALGKPSSRDACQCSSEVHQRRIGRKNLIILRMFYCFQGRADCNN